MNKKKIILVIALLLSISALGFRWYVGDYYRADETAIEAMAENEIITVKETDNKLVFSPENTKTGFIFYPGGKVEYTAYAPLMKKLAEHDILCILVEMPFNLAVLDMDAANGIPEEFPEIENWYIGGHSLGGSMAASFLEENADNFEGLILLASYSTADLSNTDLDVLSIYGSEDGVLNMEKYEEYYDNLPQTLSETVIAGGNHAGFGSYGFQDGDREATISSEEQLELTVEEIVELVK